ncbi:MAG TPA: MarR family transcriptional regulator [Steroidobacteraceae bacterium]|nr:MarR family transcriptional regulator [Steroidobacteraceae bacterium]
MTGRIREKHDGALTGSTDVRVWLRLLSCSTIIEKRLRRRFAERFGSTLPRFDVLATIERHPEGVTMGELSRSLLVSNGNVTALVRQLEGAGMVATRPAPGDRRSSIVEMTAEGRAHFAELAVAHHGWIKGMFKGMQREDQMALYRGLAMLKASIAADHDDGDGDRE